MVHLLCTRRSHFAIHLNLNTNPYVPPNSNDAGIARTPSRLFACPVCCTRIPWLRKLTLFWACPACKNRIGFRPQFWLVIPSLIIGAFPFFCIWILVRAEPLRIFDFGYWLLVPVTTIHFVPWLIGQVFGRPTLMLGWRWAKPEQLTEAQNAHEKDNG